MGGTVIRNMVNRQKQPLAFTATCTAFAIVGKYCITVLLALIPHVVVEVFLTPSLANFFDLLGIFLTPFIHLALRFIPISLFPTAFVLPKLFWIGLTALSPILSPTRMTICSQPPLASLWQEFNVRLFRLTFRASLHQDHRLAADYLGKQYTFCICMSTLPSNSRGYSMGITPQSPYQCK